jgi:hypothetical protein
MLLLAPPLDAADAALAARLAASLARALPDHAVAQDERVAFGLDDVVRVTIALRRPLARTLALAIFVGPRSEPLVWRAQRCAAAGVPEVWTIAAGEGMAFRWRWPDAGRYRRRDDLPPDVPVAPDAAPERWIVPWLLRRAAADVVGPASGP